MDPKILHYNNAVLRESDLNLLKGPRFLNDTIIEFYFDHLSSLYQSDDILLVPPSISFWLANAPDRESIRATTDPLNLRERQLIFFTVNDNTDFMSSNGGSHWSLLVYCRRWNSFMHYDSRNEMNEECAFSLYESMKGYVGCGNSSYYVECQTPQQQNGYDCGLYVMEIARVICESYLNNPSGDINEGWFLDMSRHVNRHYVESEMRSALIRLAS